MSNDPRETIPISAYSTKTAGFGPSQIVVVLADDFAEAFNADPIDYSHLPYAEYLQTEHWQKLRRVCLERSYNACNRCGSSVFLQVHHRNYERLGQERMIDLEVLCDSCHKKEHNK